MKVTSISYQKTFNLGNFSSERLGVEVEVGEHEYADELMKEAKELVEKMHRDGNPGLYYQVNPQFANHLPPEQVGTQVKTIEPQAESSPFVNTMPMITPMTKEQKKASMMTNYIELVKLSTTEKSLALYKKIVDREANPELTEAYNNKLSELQKQPA